MVVKEVESLHKIRFMDCDPIGHLSNIRYLDYMLNAREDHIHDSYGIDNYSHSKQTGKLWVALQNQIGYLKEVKFNQSIYITSKIIRFSNRTHTSEILMYNKDRTIIHAVLWIKMIYFDLSTRKSERQSEEFMKLFEGVTVKLPQDLFEDRAEYLREQNKQAFS